MDFITTPHKDINYNFIFYSYFVLGLVCLALYGIDKTANIEQLKGYYIIFTPFPPLLIWAYWMKSKATEMKAAVADTDKKTN